MRARGDEAFVQDLQQQNRDLRARRESMNPLMMMLNLEEDPQDQIDVNADTLWNDFEEDDIFGEGGGLGGGEEASDAGGMGGDSGAGGINPTKPKPTEDPPPGTEWVWSKNHDQWEPMGGLSEQQKQDIGTGKADPFAVDSNGDGKMTLLGDDKGKVKIDDGTGEKEVNKWEDDMLFEDKNNDGKFQADEIQSTKDPEAIKKSGFDKNNDGKLDEAEAKAGNLKFVSYDKNTGKEQVRGFGEEGPGGKPGIKSFGYNLTKPGQTGTKGVEEKGRSTAEFTNGQTADTINFDFTGLKKK